MSAEARKEIVKEFIETLGVDDVGFAEASSYDSPRSPSLESIFPDVKTIIVLAYAELPSCESDNMMIAMNGRLDLMEFSRSCNYRLARFLGREFGAKAMTVPVSYPLLMSRETQGAVADVSARHSAVAAGLGSFGRNNLVLHPRFGCRIIFTEVLTDLELPGDPPLTGSLCNDCMECVETCPSGALDTEGRTDVLACLKVSQPYGIGGNIRFWSKWAEADTAERQAMLMDDKYWKIQHAGYLGFQYFCFNCIKNCPIGQE